MKPINNWLNEYAESHQHRTNVLIHWICVPAIFWSITGFLLLITIPIAGNLAIPALAAMIFYYMRLSATLWPGMLLFSIICLWTCFRVFTEIQYQAAWVFSAVFLAAWIFQFYGHHLEGKRPSFLKDLQFLLIGPAWLMAKLYKKLHLPV